MTFAATSVSWLDRPSENNCIVSAKTDTEDASPIAVPVPRFASTAPTGTYPDEVRDEVVKADPEEVTDAIVVVGGLSKEHVVAVSWEGAVESGPGLIVLVALIVTAAVTAAYCTRAYLLLTAHVRPAAESAPVPPAVRGVLVVLVVLSVVGGLVLLTDAFLVGQTSMVWVFITVLAIVVGGVVALRGGLDRDPAEVLTPHSSLC